MAKEIRLNDKMWFGKYKGLTIKKIIDMDRGFLEVMKKKDKIIYSDSVLKYTNDRGSYMCVEYDSPVQEPTNEIESLLDTLQ